MVINWYKDKDKILQQIVDSHRNLIKKNDLLCIRNLKNTFKAGIRSKGKYYKQELELFFLFLQKRFQKKKVQGIWFRLMFKRLLNKAGIIDFKYSAGWFDGFKSRFPVALRKRTRKKGLPVYKKAESINNFYTLLHQIRNSKKYKHQCDIYGAFAAQNTYVMDEVPCPFVFDEDTTYDLKGAKTVEIESLPIGIYCLFLIIFVI